MLNLSLESARHLHLKAQGLQHPLAQPAQREDLLAAIRRMALLQIDTIHVVARSPYLVLWSRLGHYDPRWLDDALKAGQLFEYWAHEACFIPAEDFGLMRHRMLNPEAMGWKYSTNWRATHAQEIARLMEMIRANGPVRASDFSRPGGKKGSGWWDWKPEKRHLEVMLTAGQLMVTSRHNFQRNYDLTERVRPDWNDARDLLSEDATRTTLIRQTCRALGIVKAAWIGDYYRLGRGRYQDDLHDLADQGELVPARIEGLAGDFFVPHDLAAELADQESLPSSVTTLLSPFDPVVWDRRRVAELFNFQYRIECYTPAEKRQFGYFVLPVLSRGRLVARLDAKAHRKQGVFEIKSFHLEAGVKKTEQLRADILNAIQRCADWHACPDLRYPQIS